MWQQYAFLWKRSLILALTTFPPDIQWVHGVCRSGYSPVFAEILLLSWENSDGFSWKHRDSRLQLCSHSNFNFIFRKRDAALCTSSVAPPLSVWLSHWETTLTAARSSSQTTTIDDIRKEVMEDIQEHPVCSDQQATDTPMFSSLLSLKLHLAAFETIRSFLWQISHRLQEQTDNWDGRSLWLDHSSRLRTSLCLFKSSWSPIFLWLEVFLCDSKVADFRLS